MFKGNASGSSNPLPISAIQSVALVTQEQYSFNQARLDRMQRILDNWKAGNEQKYDQWIRMQNEMINVVEAGEQAK